MDVKAARWHIEAFHVKNHFAGISMRFKANGEETGLDFEGSANFGSYPNRNQKPERR
ncbi:MAG: hypothetical protein ACLTOI_04150 [Faecalibacterium sp.]